MGTINGRASAVSLGSCQWLGSDDFGRIIRSFTKRPPWIQWGFKSTKSTHQRTGCLSGRYRFWHQLIDRNDTYLETSATAIYAFSITRAINRGYIDKAAYAPAALLAWNAVATKVNDKGEVEGTCVGTGMGFDPAFYYYRPINVFAAHGYGPVILAGSEIIIMLKNNEFEINDSSLQLKPRK